ncbi:IS21-like element ISSso4 family transposase, partial [Shigella sonnei]|nr:IS21-like element ISSso4 family transposase [Shigella sonnei]EGD9711586.1 IS21-like element ISSso4 family transposase [Shigella sonnei]EGM8529692.1 IS21-like element ISSso4 family transposase [Shigella sonnei]
METCFKILQLKFDKKLTNRCIGLTLHISASTVFEVLARFKASSLSWPLPADISHDTLEKLIFPPKDTSASELVMPDMLYFDTEMRKPGVTRQLLWMEYKAQAGDKAMGYSHFCRCYRKWKKTRRLSMRQEHRAGEKLFIDFCGPTVPVINPDTGEIRRVAIFVAVMGASNYTYVEACEGQDMMSWLNAHSRCLTFLGGVPKLLIPDNLRSAVKKADRYEPVINDSYQALAEHYGTVIIPARPRKPKDKPKAENGVLIVERWLLARIRNETFHTLRALNARLRELLTDMNNRPMKGYGNQTRAERFRMLDAPALSPLPLEPYEYTEYKAVKVGPDYHVEYARHWYSVPHELVGQRLSLKVGQSVVQLWHKGQCVAQHPRSTHEYKHTTNPLHMPERHRRHGTWTPERLIEQGNRTGPSTGRVVESMLKAKLHPELAYRAVLGLLALQKKYGPERLEKACYVALHYNAPDRRFIDNLLRHHRDNVELPLSRQGEQHPAYASEHENLR